MLYEAIRFEGKVGAIQRNNPNGSTSSIPLDPKNTDYMEFLLWLKDNALDLTDKPWSPSQEQIDREADRSDIKTQYQNAVDKLNAIIQAQSPTNAQVVAAVKDLAQIQLRILKILRWLV